MNETVSSRGARCSKRTGLALGTTTCFHGVPCALAAAAPLAPCRAAIAIHARPCALPPTSSSKLSMASVWVADDAGGVRRKGRRQSGSKEWAEWATAYPKNQPKDQHPLPTHSRPTAARQHPRIAVSQRQLGVRACGCQRGSQV